jgi:hypothetical protein
MCWTQQHNIHLFGRTFQCHSVPSTRFRIILFQVRRPRRNRGEESPEKLTSSPPAKRLPNDHGGRACGGRRETECACPVQQAAHPVCSAPAILLAAPILVRNAIRFFSLHALCNLECITCASNTSPCPSTTVHCIPFVHFDSVLIYAFSVCRFVGCRNTVWFSCRRQVGWRAELSSGCC